MTINIRAQASRQTVFRVHVKKKKTSLLRVGALVERKSGQVFPFVLTRVDPLLKRVESSMKARLSAPSVS